MTDGHKVIVVLPAYNAERTLEDTYRRIPRQAVDEILLVDDGSHDQTVAVAKRLNLPYVQHASNCGYGANQKTCYQAALTRGADIVVMLHPDSQYPPEQVPALAALIASGRYDVALGSRFLNVSTLARGMPRYKFFCNRLWTWLQNRWLGQRLSEYHTGFRAFSRAFLLGVPLLENSNDFLFDNQVLLQALHFGFRIGELSTPACFTKESSSISPWRGAWYGLGVLWATLRFHLHRAGLLRCRLLEPDGRRLSVASAHA